MNSKLFILLLAISTPTYSIAKEKLEFSCITENHGKVTIHSTKNKEYYIYRFYKKGKLQLTIKQDKKTITHQSKQYTYSARYNRNNMTFINGKYICNINSDYNFNKKDNVRYDGFIIITRTDDENFAQMLDCKFIKEPLSDDHLVSDE